MSISSKVILTLLINFISWVRWLEVPCACAPAPSLPARSIKFSTPLVSISCLPSRFLDSTTILNLNIYHIEWDLELFKLKLVQATWRLASPKAKSEYI